MDPKRVVATSAGTETVALPSQLWETKPFCYDLAYRQGAHTPFVDLALTKGCAAADGLGMLVEQAAEAFAIWHGFTPETPDVLHALYESKNPKT